MTAQTVTRTILLNPEVRARITLPTYDHAILFENHNFYPIVLGIDTGEFLPFIRVGPRQQCHINQHRQPLWFCHFEADIRLCTVTITALTTANTNEE